MKLFPNGHATHPQWRMAAALVLAQLRAQMALPHYANAPTLGLLYITDHYADEAEGLLDFLSAELPEVTDWSGTVGVGVAANNAEYFDEPALSVMLLDLPADQYRVFSGVAPLTRGGAAGGGSGFVPHTALVHVDGDTPDLAELIAEMSDRTVSGYLFGGIAASRSRSVQFAVGGNGNIAGQGAARGVFGGGLSGVAFGRGVGLLSRVTQGCQPVGPFAQITGAQDNVVLELDGEPALDVLLRTLGVTLDGDPQPALRALRATLAGLVDAGAQPMGRTGHFGTDVRVRHLVGLDPMRQGVALADKVEEGMRLAFCQRNVAAARADLMRICAEIREELAPEAQEPVAPPPVAGGERAALMQALAHATDGMPERTIVGAIYVSCSGRGGPHFGGPSAELQIVRHALGDVPLVGFFAGGEIAHHHLYGYTGVLTVFTCEGFGEA
ncbi:FIST C-terminal domain-containing protein [Acidovorax sp. GBBC 3334]|uniref:FIST signal transduction protein n=1 Tax=unclassified Acidovorax TaxID=2684926 RepID=UPI0023039307|nr:MULTISPECIES: FIST C-terminal domain-containing protein [unclassified Acidovorax]MDA8456031.1 FIST C-terminal domain-containing protein [Acidovorax sp. GBBC 3334]MDA8523649.1 FIST C-terminal domain-containing protein [Acidovorax sp. NCPPB 4044]